MQTDRQPETREREVVVRLTERESTEWSALAVRLGVDLPELVRMSAETAIVSRSVWCPRIGGIRCE